MFGRILILISFVLLVSCSTIRLTYEAKFKKNDNPELNSFKYQRSYRVGSTQNWCFFTGIAYGGACWGYLLMPNAKQEKELKKDAEFILLREINLQPNQINLQDIQVSRDSWSAEPESFEINGVKKIGTEYSFDERLFDRTGDFEISNVEESEGSGIIELTYESSKQLNIDADKKIRNEMLDDKGAQKIKSLIPNGGRLVFSIYQLTIGAANTEYFSYVVKINGEELYRKDGQPRIPSTPTHYGSKGVFWRNLDYIDLKNEIQIGDSIEVFVINKLSDTRDVFSIKRIK